MQRKSTSVLSRRALLSGSLALVGCGRTQQGFSGHAFVANEEGKAVAVVRFDPFSVVKHIPLPSAPGALLTHPSRPVVWVPAPADGTIHEIDAAHLTHARKVKVGQSLAGLRLSPDASFLWSLSGRRLARLPVESLAVDRRIDVAFEGTDFDLAPWTGLGAVASAGEGTVQMCELETGRVLPPIKVADRLGAIRFRSDGKALLVAHQSERMLTVLEAPSGRVITRLPLAVRPDHLCFNRDNGQLFITGEGMDAVVVVYPHYVPRVAETALAGRAPGAMAASENYLFVTSPSTGDLIVMNVETRRVIAVASVGAEPSFVAVTPNDTYALVLNRRSGDMAVIRIGAITLNRQKSVALLTMVPVGSKPVSAVVTNV